MKIKPMRYKEHRTLEVLYKDTYRGYNYFIINYGTHPCAYVEIPKNHSYFKKSYMDIEDIEVHGGLTFSSDKLLLLDNSWFIGWDYAHYGDYVGFSPDIFGINDEEKKWTTEEIIDECISVINQLIEIKKED